MRWREPLIGERIPFKGRLADDVPLCDDNSVFAMFEVAGVYPDTADDIDLETWFNELHNVQKNVAAEDIELFRYKCRGHADPRDFPAPAHPYPFAAELDGAYRAHLFAGSLYINRLYLSIQIHPPGRASQGVARFFADDTDPRAAIDERKRRLNEICDLLQTQLSRFGLRRLGYVERDGILYDEIAEAYVFATTGLFRMVAATTGRMGNAMFSEDLQFRRRHIKFEGAGDHYAVMYALKNYPVSTAPWMLHALDLAPYRCTVIQSYRFLSNGAAGDAIDRKQNKMHLAGDKAADQKEELSRAHNRLLNREFVLGDHSLLVLAFAATPRDINPVSNAVWRDLIRCGLHAVRVTRILQAAWLSAFPGNARLRPRPSYINSINYGAFAPLYNWPQGERTGNLPGPEIALFRTLAGTPYRYHWSRDRGGSILSSNTLVTGDSGSGKTSLVGLLIALTSGRARIITLDHKQGWRRLFQHLGGDYAALGAGQPHLAPLKFLDPTPSNIEFLISLIRGCIDGSMTEEEGRRLTLGMRTVMHMPPEDRSLSELRSFFDNSPEGAGVRLNKWIWPHGELGWVIDAPQHTVNFSNLCCYDTTALLNNERACSPALACIFYQIFLALDGSPALIPIDEGWRALVHKVFREFVGTQLRMIRSKGGILVFVTQSPSDINDSEIANLLREQCPNAFHMANPRGKRADYVDGLGLTEGEFEAFHALQDGQGLFLLKQETRSVIAQAPMHGLDHYLRILSAPESDLREFDAAEQFQEAAE